MAYEGQRCTIYAGYELVNGEPNPGSLAPEFIAQPPPGWATKAGSCGQAAPVCGTVLVGLKGTGVQERVLDEARDWVSSAQQLSL